MTERHVLVLHVCVYITDDLLGCMAVKNKILYQSVHLLSELYFWYERNYYMCDMTILPVYLISITQV